MKKRFGERLRSRLPIVAARVIVFFGLSALFILAQPAEDGQLSVSPEPDRRTATAFDEVEIGEIVGAQYIPELNRFIVYALVTPPFTILRRDYVVKLAQVAHCCVERWGFSLEFERDGRTAFRLKDISSPGGLALKISQSTDPISRSVRQGLSGKAQELLRSYHGPADPPARLTKELLKALNKVRRDENLRDIGRLIQRQLAEETQELLNRQAGAKNDFQRLGRLILEDVYGEELDQHLAAHYVIRYVPFGKKERQLQEILNSSAVQKVLLFCDTALKRFAYALELPEDLSLGASQLFLCQSELQQWLASGKKMEAYSTTPFLIYFELESEMDFENFDGLGFWFRDSRIVVKAATRVPGQEPPECVRRFAEILTANMPALLSYEGELGSEFRKLKAILLLSRILGWMEVISVPVNWSIIRAFPTASFENQPPALQDFPMIFAQGADVRGFSYRGGIRFPPPPENGRSEEGRRKYWVRAQDPKGTVAASLQGTSGSAQGFDVFDQLCQGRKVLRIDISSLLGLRQIE